MPGYSGRKPPPPPPHTSSGKGACSLTALALLAAPLGLVFGVVLWVLNA